MRVDFKEVKEKVPVTSLMHHYKMKAARKGKELVASCPLCGGSDSFKASEEKGAWRCFSCKKGGNVLDLAAQMERTTVKGGAEWLYERFIATGTPGEAAGASERGTPLAEAMESPEKRHNDELTLSLKLYTEETDWNPKTLEHYGAGQCRRGMHRGRLALPLHNRHGDLTGYVGRGEDSDKYPPQYIRGLEVYNLHRAQGKMAVLVPDYFDVWRYWEANGREAVCLPGKEITDTQVEELALAGIKAVDIRIYDCPEIIEKLVFDFYVRLSRK